MIAELGTDEKVVVKGMEKVKEREDGNDNFGVTDEDWDVYREIQKDGFSEDEEEDQNALAELEDNISELDPKFSLLLYTTKKMPTAEDFQIRLWTDRYRGSEILFQPSIVGLETEGITEILENMLNSFGRPTLPLYDARISQTDILQKLQASTDTRQKLLSYVLITGGNTLVQNFDKRIESELRMLNPIGTHINVVKAYDQ